MDTLREVGLPAERLEIEITETAALSKDEDVLADLHQLHAMGVRLSLDDFGAGYSSFSHLRTFPVGKIKIDGAFVRDAAERPECAAVVKATADIGRRLGIPVVAECVETEEQFHSIVLEGCTEAQGYFISTPKPSARDLDTINILNGNESSASFVKGNEMDIYISGSGRLREIYNR
jgi:predicted signal transduction protein with EAL and GGDEF domain